MKNCWQLQRRDCLTISVVAPQEVRVDAAVASFILELEGVLQYRRGKNSTEGFSSTETVYQPALVGFTSLLSWWWHSRIVDLIC